MKLIGSKTESEYREQLINLTKVFLSKNSDSKLKNIVLSKFPDFKTAFVLSCLPDESTYIYHLLIDGREILNIEIEQDETVNPIVRHTTLSQYLYQINKQNHIQLLVAQALHNEKLAQMASG